MTHLLRRTDIPGPDQPIATDVTQRYIGDFQEQF